MKSANSLRRAQCAMRWRVRNGRGPGRPQLAINEDQVMEFLFQGYAPRGIALALDCSLSTLKRRFPMLRTGQIDWRRLVRPWLFKLAIQYKDPVALLYFARALVREEKRCAAREEEREMEREEQEIQRRIRGEQ